MVLFLYFTHQIKFRFMKKIILVIAVAIFALSNVNGQVDGSAIGLRFNYAGAEISYQHPLSQTNRIEADLGYNSWGLALTGVYHWVWDLSSVTDGLNWYAGGGLSTGIHNSYLGLGIVGQIGAEYNFSIPLQLSLDYRPGFYFLPGIHPQYDGICLSARYRF